MATYLQQKESGLEDVATSLAPVISANEPRDWNLMAVDLLKLLSGN